MNLMMHYCQYQRRSSGQAIVVLVVVLAAFIVAPLGMLVFEMARYSIAGQQLRSCVESTALAAAATNASSNEIDAVTTQQSAIAVGMDMLKRQSILGYSLSQATQASSLPLHPDANQVQVYFEFLDPITRQTVPLGSTRGKIIRVTGSFGVVPLFGQFLQISGVYPVTSSCNSGLPMLDIVLCFDISASMDDFTPVSVVDRYRLDQNSNGYRVLAQGPLYTAFGCRNSTGTAINATFPQSLDSSSSDGYYTFNSSYRGTNHGSPAPSSMSSRFTDLVVHPDGTNFFTNGATIDGYLFPAGNVACLVEAARGNLESPSIAANAHVPYSSWGITPRAGYYQAYCSAAMANRHPIQDAILASQNFFTIMNTDSDVHFGLVSFGTNAGANSNSTAPSDYGYYTIGNITNRPSSYYSNSYPTDPLNPNPPNPGISLNPTLGPSYSNYAEVSDAVAPLLAYGGTNIAGALDAALSQLKTTDEGGQGLSRKGATRAIVLFTDGLPTTSSVGGDPIQTARYEAKLANQYGIPIYCIGLCMVPSLQSSQTAILTDQNSNPNSGGIAGISGNGAVFYQATDASQLNTVFQNVARALVQLVR